MGLHYNLGFMFSIIQRITNFYSEFYVHLLCQFSIVLYYDEMNCNLVYGVFKMYSEVQILIICKNHEFDERMNCNVKFVDT
jgi:hypothetical protein